MSRASPQELRNLIVDPIGISLRASNSHDCRGFQDLTKNHQDSLFSAKILDVWQGTDEVSRKHQDCPISARLPTGLFDCRATAAGRQKGDRCILRLLVTKPAFDLQRKVSYRDTLNVNQRQLDHLPFEEDEMVKLFEYWHLPSEWMWFRLHAYSVGNFFRRISWDHRSNPPKAIGIGLVIHFPFILRPARQFEYESVAKDTSSSVSTGPDPRYIPARDDPYIWSLATSFSIKDGETRGLLDGVTAQAFSDLHERIFKDYRIWAIHPLHVPILLHHIYVDHAAWEVDAVEERVQGFEHLTKTDAKRSLPEFDTISTELAYLGRALKFQNELNTFLIDTLKHLNVKVFVCSPSDEVQEICHVGQEMEEKLINFSYLTNNYLESCRFMSIRLKDALEYINTDLNERDTRENANSRIFQDEGLKAQLNDADSNRTISIVTLVFLPPTAVAAIASMDAFNWQKPGGGQYAPPFWLFWVISIVLTVLVFLIYLLLKNMWDKARPERLRVRGRWNKRGRSKDLSQVGSERGREDLDSVEVVENRRRSSTRTRHERRISRHSRRGEKRFITTDFV